MSLNIWKTLFIIALTISLIGLAMLIIIYSINMTTLADYAVVLDAGSTSTKLNLFKWGSNKFTYNAYVTQGAYCKEAPGISSYRYNPADSFVGLDSCLKSKIVPAIPENLRSRTSLFLGATAGMRMLKYRDSTASKEILRNISNSLTKTYPYFHFNQSSDITIISGADEGLYGWIAVNYVADNFEQSDNSQLIGALDMGGASAQVTFTIPSNTNKNNSSSHYNVNLYGNQYTVYSHSYLCYGKTQAQMRHIAAIIKDAKFAKQVFSPCFPKGVTVKFNSTDIFLAPCVRGKFAIDTFGNEIVPPTSWLQTPVEITISGNYSYNDKCILNTGNEFFPNRKCLYKSCTFNGVYQPAISGKFKAFSAFQYLKNNLNPENQQFTREDYYDSLFTKCRGKSEEENKKLGKWAKWVCFDSTYMLEYLTKIGFVDSKWDNIDFEDSASKLKNRYMGWALGYIINKSAVLPRRKHFLPISTGLFIALLLALIVVFLFGIVFVIRYSKAKKSTKTCGYEIDAENRPTEDEKEHVHRSLTGDA